MDTRKEYIIQSAKATEIQQLHTYRIYGHNMDGLILDEMSYYGIQKNNDIYYLPGFAEDYVHNATVNGYVRKPHDLRGCAVRGDLPVAYSFDNVIWIHRQDELQDLLKDQVSSCRELSLWFNQWLGALEWQVYFKVFTSMEQLWLAFVMKQKYNKVWRNNDWVKLEKNNAD